MYMVLKIYMNLDFKNDKIVAEPFGSGAHAVALYELTPVKNNKTAKMIENTMRIDINKIQKVKLDEIEKNKTGKEKKKKAKK